MLCFESWIASQGVRDISVGDLGKFFDAHEAFKLKKWPGGGIKKAVKNSGELLRWYKATAASPAPRIGLGDTAIPSITSTDLCDSLKQWLLSTNRSQVNMSELLKFYEAYPQFKNVRFDTETGVLIDKTEGKGSGIKKCLEGYTSLRWCPDQGHGARIELVRNPVENDLVRALHAWLLAHDKTEIGADELEPFWVHATKAVRSRELKKLCENSSLLTWVSDETMRIAVNVPVAVHSKGYLMHCDDRTESECLQRSLLGCGRHVLKSTKGSQLQNIKSGDRMYLYNIRQGKVRGPFIAIGEAGLNLVEGAFGGHFDFHVRVAKPGSTPPVVWAHGIGERKPPIGPWEPPFVPVPQSDRPRTPQSSVSPRGRGLNNTRPAWLDKRTPAWLQAEPQAPGPGARLDVPPPGAPAPAPWTDGP